VLQIEVASGVENASDLQRTPWAWRTALVINQRQLIWDRGLPCPPAPRTRAQNHLCVPFDSSLELHSEHALPQLRRNWLDSPLGEPLLEFRRGHTDFGPRTPTD